MSITYTDGTEEGSAAGDRTMTRVPDWLQSSPDLTLPGVTLDRYLNGTSAVTAPKPRLYVLKFKVHPDYVASGYSIKSITLPRIGTDLRNDCSTAALHVFAIAFSDG